MLCDGCTQVVARERVSARTASTDPVEDRQPAGSATSDFGWDNDLGPEGVHPLMAPLPNSMWERFSKKQELRGKPLVPMASQIKINQKMRGESGGKTAALKTADKDLSHNAHTVTPGKVMTKHLEEHHDLPYAEAYVHGYGASKHLELHNSGADHTHDPSGAVVPNAPHAHTKMSEKELDSHLTEHHGLPAASVKTLKNFLNPGQTMHGLHAGYHEDPNSPAAPTISHKHSGEDFSSSPEVNGKKQSPHPGSMTSGGLKAHLLADHDMPGDHIANAIDATAKGAMPIETMKALHDKAHSQGIGVDSHEHAEGWDHQSFVHQDPHGVDEHLGHLKHAHGIGDEELAQKAEASGGDPELHHQKLKELHYDLHDHDAGSYIKHGAPNHTHSGHSDVGQAFLGSKGGDSEYESGAHLQHSHGLLVKDLTDITKSEPDYISPQQAYETAHAALHAKMGENVDHQHVPTIKEGVKTPEKIAKEKMVQHFKDHHPEVSDPDHMSVGSHASLHDPEAWGYKGHPGHEHENGWAGKVVKALPTEKSGKPLTHAHASDMSHKQLKGHLIIAHNNTGDDLHLKSHSELLQQHATEHATGAATNPWNEGEKLPAHNHGISQSGHDAFGRKLYGGDEPEPNAKIHPAVEDESGALAHIIQHHPNISAETYDTYKGGDNPQKSMQNFHAKLHAGNTGLPAAPDGHEHAEKQGPSTHIPIGSHLVSHHGMSQEQVASMSPAEFKAHHEELHTRHEEADLGHGHITPGGKVRGPIDSAINPHHAKMRENPDHPAVTEWYHGTSNDFEGPPKNATELMEDHSQWGNYGGGDWNNHAGTHWSSLHDMARNFGSGDNRVVHAKLHMKNPITYNSLNHMSHDAYDRLHASGDMQDGGEFLGKHDDDNGYNECCSKPLLHYAKGGHRSDGKYGMERYRDSLRASGHDGILVRNQADDPSGHWNAIPLHADQVEITHGSCHFEHGDERDNDVAEFNANKKKLTEGWEHPKHFDSMAYTKGKPLPDVDDVTAAHERKKQAPEPTHIREGRGERRGDANPNLNGRDLGGGGGDDDDDSDEDEEHFCSHCDEYGDHTSDNCDNKWCKVCDTHTSHTAEEEHPYCDHCDDYADHDSDDHEDEWGEHPDKMKNEGYCPHCEESTKQNYGEDKCTSCNEKLPDWGHMASHGTPIKKGQYNKSGHSAISGTKVDALDEDEDPEENSLGYGSGLAAHLYHHHGAEVGGKEFDKDDDWDEDALEAHHAHLHLDPAWAKDAGFKTGTHSHKQKFGEFKSHESMTPHEIHAHMMLGHAGDPSTPGYAPMGDIFKMSPDEAVKEHQKLHATDDAVPWGQKDEDDNIKAKVDHHHQVPDKQPSNAPAGHSPTGDELISHLNEKHLKVPVSLKSALKKHPETADALHQQMHDCKGPAASELGSKYHTHTASEAEENADKGAFLQHLQEHHGFGATHHMNEQLQGMTSKELAAHHVQEHNSMFPMGNDPDHSHANNDPHSEKWTQHEAHKTSARLSLVDYFQEAAV
jgi:hypothetical protein